MIAVTLAVGRGLGRGFRGDGSFEPSTVSDHNLIFSSSTKPPDSIKGRMIYQTKLLEIISGRRRGILAASMRAVLWALTPVYRFAVERRNKRFENDPHAITKVDVPVIAIGNLTTGGTGKTPLVIWLCQQIRKRDRRVAIISRGYGAEAGAGQAIKPNDEAMELGQRLPDVPHLQNPDRVASANIAIDELETQCIVMDDGFQHRRLHRDLDIVVIDATNPFGYGYLLPRGLLREPIKNVSRADGVVISRCDQVSEADLSQIESVVRAQAANGANEADLPIARTKVHPATWLQFDGQQKTLSSMQTTAANTLNSEPNLTKVFVCCAIGNPDSFLETVSSVGVSVVGHKFLPDHHLYDRQDIDSIAASARTAGADAIVCTHKDLVKIGVNQFQGLPIYALVAEIVFLEGEQQFLKEIEMAIGAG